MRISLKSEPSPERNRPRREVEDNQAKGPLSPREREMADAVLRDPVDFVADDQFPRSNAKKKLFDDAPTIPQPNTSWYHPVMEDAGPDRSIRGVVNVVLDAKQEQALFLQFNYARYRVNRIQKKVGEGQLDNEQAAEILLWYRMAMRLRDQIAQSNLALVLAMAKRIRHSDMDFSDLISEGNMALLRAIDKFDVSRGFKFSTYACRAILKAFSRSGIKHSLYRQLFPTDFDPAMEKSDFHRRKFDQHEDDCANEVKRIVINNRAELTDVEQQVISHRFALNSDRMNSASSSAPLTLEQVGQIVGLTKERVRQIQNKALEKIRRTLEAAYLDGNQLKQFRDD